MNDDSLLVLTLKGSIRFDSLRMQFLPKNSIGQGIGRQPAVIWILSYPYVQKLLRMSMRDMNDILKASKGQNDL